MGMIEDAVLTERVPFVRRLFADHAGNQARHGFQEDECGKLSAREHVVADGDLLRRQSLDEPFVDPLVAPTDEGQGHLSCELANELLVEPAPGG